MKGDKSSTSPTQDKREEHRAIQAQFGVQGENFIGSSWGDKKFRRALSFFTRYLGDSNSARVLDIGCGGMTLSMYLKKSTNFEMYGVDLDAVILTELARRRAPNIPLAAGDIEALPYSDCSFDVVVHNQVLHHFRSLRLALPEIKRVLKPGGMLWSIETNGWNPYIYWCHHSPKKKERDFVGDNEFPFGFTWYKKQVRNAGFLILGSKLVNFDFVNFLSPFDEIFSKVPGFNLVFAGSMLVCSQKLDQPHQ